MTHARENFVTYDEYVELYSDWQSTLLDTADKIANAGNVHVRRYWRNKLQRQFTEFLRQVDETELKIAKNNMTPSIRFNHSQKYKMATNASDTEGTIGSFDYGPDAPADDNTVNTWNAGVTSNEITEAINGTPGIFDDADEDDPINGDFDFDHDADTVQGNFDYDEEGSVDMMFSDLNELRDEYQEFLRLTDQEDLEERDIQRLGEIAEELHASFMTIRDAIMRRMNWCERIANEALGWIDQPRTTVYLQNTGRGIPVVETNIEATMLGTDNYSYGIMVPARVYNDDGTFTDYNTAGRRI